MVDLDTREQIDLLHDHKQIKNPPKNIEEDTKANINTDWYPAVGTIETKLRKLVTDGLNRCGYQTCCQEANTSLSSKLEDTKPNSMQGAGNIFQIEQWLTSNVKETLEGNER